MKVSIGKCAFLENVHFWKMFEFNIETFVRVHPEYFREYQKFQIIL